MDIVIIGTPNDNSLNSATIFPILLVVDGLQFGECLENGVGVGVILGFDVGETLDLGKIVTMHLLILS